MSAEPAAPRSLAQAGPHAPAMAESHRGAAGDRVTSVRIVRRHVTGFAALTAVVAMAPRLLYHPNAPTRMRVLADPLLGGWLRWDGWWYVAIARSGYTYRPHHMSSVAFFPTYPLIVRVVSTVVPGGAALAAIATTLAAGSVSLVLLYRWCARRMSPRAANAAVVTVALYPFAWFLYGAAYSDAVYLALDIGAFLLLEDDRLWWAAAVGAIATACRPTAITLVIGLVAVAVDRAGTDRAHTRRVAAASASLIGLGLWCTWLTARFGNPFAFIETEGAPGWNQPPGVRTWLKLDLFTKLGKLPPPESVAVVLQIVMVVVFLALLPLVRRQFGRGYAIYAAAAIAVPTISTGDFLGVGRYVLAAFPVFAAVGAASQTMASRRIYVVGAVSSALLVVGTALFSAGYLVA